jgi:hypothetical protein
MADGCSGEYKRYNRAGFWSYRNLRLCPNPTYLMIKSVVLGASISAVGKGR